MQPGVKTVQIKEFFYCLLFCLLLNSCSDYQGNTRQNENGVFVENPYSGRVVRAYHDDGHYIVDISLNGDEYENVFEGRGSGNMSVIWLNNHLVQIEIDQVTSYSIKSRFVIQPAINADGSINQITFIFRN